MTWCSKVFKKGYMEYISHSEVEEKTGLSWHCCVLWDCFRRHISKMDMWFSKANMVFYSTFHNSVAIYIDVFQTIHFFQIFILCSKPANAIKNFCKRQWYDRLKSCTYGNDNIRYISLLCKNLINKWIYRLLYSNWDNMHGDWLLDVSDKICLMLNFYGSPSWIHPSTHLFITVQWCTIAL